MPEDRNIPAPDSTDLPSLNILVEGTEIPQEVQVFSVNLARIANQVTKAVLIFRDGDAALEDFPLSAEDLFLPGKKVKINAGYHEQNEPIFEGIIVRHSIEFEGTGEGILKVECMDEAVKMTITRKNSYFPEDKKDSDIIKQLIKDNGLKAEVDDTKVTHPWMVQYYATDWDFLVARAEVNGLLVYTLDGTVAVKAPDTGQSAKFNIIHGSSMYDFNASIDSRYQFPDVKAYAWNPSDQKNVEKPGKVSGFTEQGNVKSDDLSSQMGIDHLQLQHPGFIQDSELEEWSNATMMRSRLAKITGTVRFQGVADVYPGDVIELQGVGARFNGNVFVTGVLHEINTANWETEVQFGLSREWFSKRYNDIVDQPAAGLLPGMNGLQIGVVKNIHEDPDGEYRVQVVMPTVSESESGIWARVATLDAGDGRGSFFRPELDDEVILGFLNDDPRQPVILGMVHSSKLPSPLEPEEANAEKGFVSRSGIKLLFEDENVNFTIETPNGNKLLLSDENGSINIEDENGNKIEMSSDGILISSAKDLILEAPQGDVKVTGLNIEQAADIQFKAEGTAGIEVSSSANAVLKGAIVQIN